MATISSAQTGNWATGATWVGGSPPGNNDFGQIEAPHVVTIAANAQAKGIIINGGSLVLNAEFKFTDTGGAEFSVKAVNSGGFVSDGTASAWRKMRSENNQPANRWSINIYPITGTDLRTLNFNNVELEGHKFMLGNSNLQINMNDTTKNDYLNCEQVSPAMRESALIENPIRGRTAGRIYKGYYSASSMVIQGSCRYDSSFPILVDSLQKAGQRIAFFSRYWHLPKCRIDGKPIFTQRKGQYLDWSIVLREDV